MDRGFPGRFCFAVCLFVYPGGAQSGVTQMCMHVLRPLCCRKYNNNSLLGQRYVGPIIGIIYRGNHKESPGKEVEVVWACDEKRGTLRRKEGDGY